MKRLIISLAFVLLLAASEASAQFFNLMPVASVPPAYASIPFTPYLGTTFGLPSPWLDYQLDIGRMQIESVIARDTFARSRQLSELAQFEALLDRDDDSPVLSPQPWEIERALSKLKGRR